MARVQEKAFSSKSLLRASAFFEQLGVVGAQHQGLIAVALLGDAGDFAVEGVLAGAGLLGLLVKSVQAEERTMAKRARMPMPMRRRLRAGPRSAKGRVARLSVMRMD